MSQKIPLWLVTILIAVALFVSGVTRAIFTDPPRVIVTCDRTAIVYVNGAQHVCVGRSAP